MNESKIRIISNGNPSMYPQNTSAQFTNLIMPEIQCKYIGILKISFNIDKSKIIYNNPKFLNDNSFFFINSSLVEGTQIANQLTSSLQDFHIDLLNLPDRRIVIDFEKTFTYSRVVYEKFTELDILITNLNGEPHPLLFKDTIITLKFTMSENQQNTIRLVSSANRGAYPQNVADDFINQLYPPIEKVDSIALSSITIPIKETITPPPPSDSSTTTFSLKRAEKKLQDEFPFAKFTCKLEIVHQSGFVEMMTFLINFPGYGFDRDNINTQPTTDFKEMLTRMQCKYWTPSDTLVYSGEPLKFDIVYKGQSKFSNKGPIVGVKCVYFIHLSSFLYKINIPNILYSYRNNNFTVTFKKVMTFDLFSLANNDISFFYDSTNLATSNNPSHLLVLCDQTDSISYGSDLRNILSVVPIDINTVQGKNIVYNVPLSCVNFLRTISNQIQCINIKITDFDFKPVSYIDKDKSTVVKLLIDNGSNSEIREGISN